VGDGPLFVIPAKAGIQLAQRFDNDVRGKIGPVNQINLFRHGSRERRRISRWRRFWIPASAGMTMVGLPKAAYPTRPIAAGHFRVVVR
jgi:hypothetical protein